MSGQIWSTPASGGYLYADELSDILRMKVQPLTKFRQLFDAKDGTSKGLHAGEDFTWNTYQDIATQGTKILENQPIPESNFEIVVKTATVTEWGNSVPYTGKLESLGKHDVVEIIDKVLKNDVRKAFDIECFEQFKLTPLRVAPTSGTSTTSVTVTENGATATTNDVALGTGHVKAISDDMKERNIPPYYGDDYVSVAHPSTYRTFKNDLESIHQYTDAGINQIFSGEIGRYESIRFIEQNQVPKGGANDSTTFDPLTKTADPWNNAKSSWAFFMGADTGVEAIVIPEEIRARIPGDFGRSKGLAWYFMGVFSLVHADVTNARMFMWDSAA